MQIYPPSPAPGQQNLHPPTIDNNEDTPTPSSTVSIRGHCGWYLGFKALLNYDTLDAETKSLVDERMKGYKDPKDGFVVFVWGPKLKIVRCWLHKNVEFVFSLAMFVWPER